MHESRLNVHITDACVDEERGKCTYVHKACVTEILKTSLFPPHSIPVALEMEAPDDYRASKSPRCFQVIFDAH